MKNHDQGGRRTALTRDEQFAIASALHAVVLDELFRATRWLAPVAVFHGGTSLALVRSSVRFSEDLDFMVDERAASKLGPIMGRLEARFDLAMSLQYPGCMIAVRGPRGKEVRTWQVAWSHPDRRNVVMVKVEFLVAREGLLASYRSTHRVPDSKGSVAVTTPIPVPQLVAAWADEIKAVATRVDFKWRDAFDLWWIARCLLREDELSVADRLDALKVTAAIYDKTLDDVARGLSRVLDSAVLTDLEAFEADMSRWFSRDVFARYRAAGQFDQALATAIREIERARSLIGAEGVR